MCSPSWTFLPPPSPHHPSGSSQCTSPKHPVSCIEPRLATRFIHDITHVSMPFSQIFPPSPSPTESIRQFYTSVSLLLSRTQGYCKITLSHINIPPQALTYHFAYIWLFLWIYSLHLQKTVGGVSFLKWSILTCEYIQHMCHEELRFSFSPANRVSSLTLVPLIFQASLPVNCCQIP